MPSTHVVYEGIKDVKENIKEEEDTLPTLSYGKSKEYNELREAHLNKNRSKVDPCNKCNVI